MKYILFIITLGGDTGWRFRNREEWHSMNYPLLFDAKLWSMEKIKEEMDRLDYQIFNNQKGTGFPLKEKGDLGAEILREFLDNVEGVYTINNKSPWGCHSKETIDMPAKEEITNWSFNGQSVNLKNQFKR